ncbi:oxygen-insensitive NADPH nitroreductase [Klebsiella pneumoniae]|uniref:Oxygen-insensitive NADPH nitroreductase n=1 Tax=Klebsiella pneumoniae TaxID=573 RepID=A0A378AGG5_KLEPN|nr:oxygen-insensitive NADPH nitroreductase [Klebsiella pneumoniae]
MLVHENRYQPLDNALLGEYDEQLAHYYLSRAATPAAIPGATISGALS